VISADRASAAIVQDGLITAAVEEERFNRQKLWHGVPRQSIDWVASTLPGGWRNIDAVATHDGTDLDQNRQPYFDIVAQRIRAAAIDEATKESQEKFLWDKFTYTERVITERDPSFIRAIEAYGKPVIRVPHHLAHAASAYFTSGWDECYALTADGWGTDASSILARCKSGRITTIASSHYLDSLGYFYGSITKYLGFKPHRHEGKVLGLAAHGNPDLLAPVMRRMIGFDSQQKTFRGFIENGIYRPSFDNPNLPRYLASYSREDIAAAAQRVLEEVVLAYVRALVPAGSKLCLAGGIFANVRLNEKILALPNIAAVYIFPNMGDGGLSAGAALYHTAQQQPLTPCALPHVYLGPTYADHTIEHSLTAKHLMYTKPADLADAVARLLADGHLVARYNGPMEYGPRALGNRSILYRADDPSVNDWLNKLLQRTEFMPFAPVTLAEHADQHFDLPKNVRFPTQFMTITCACTDRARREVPGVVHRDGTARPQLITQQNNPTYYGILKRYFALTGNPTLINTSFNMHEEPIVCTPDDAIRSFLAAKFKYLAIGPYLATKDV
ncbi:MAG: hypothetical protein HY372_03445, partial [Candidatus Andersenbacteria bacterium]|nr:hypothetical protein [Candidatus Andersenbacteria bacterium]